MLNLINRKSLFGGLVDKKVDYVGETRGGKDVSQLYTNLSRRPVPISHCWTVTLSTPFLFCHSKQDKHLQIVDFYDKHHMNMLANELIGIRIMLIVQQSLTITSNHTHEKLR